MKDRQCRSEVSPHPRAPSNQPSYSRERERESGSAGASAGRHTGPVAVEFTVFLRATLQPPLSTGVEHTLAVETISLLFIADTYASASWERGRGKEADIGVRRRDIYIYIYISLSRKQTTCRIMTLIIAGRVNSQDDSVSLLIKWNGSRGAIARFGIAKNFHEKRGKT